MVCLSGVAGLATLALCGWSRFGLARLTAALAVAAVVVGWAAAQAPRLLPGMTVTQGAAGESVLVALVIAVACGAAVLIPALALLFTLFLRGRLDTPESHSVAEPAAPPAGAGATAAAAAPADLLATDGPAAAGVPPARAGSRQRERPLGAAAVLGLVAGTGLVVLGNAPWINLLGVACLVMCAVSVFALTATAPGH